MHMSGAGSFLKRLYQLEAFVAAFAYGVLAVTVLADVVFREIFSSPVLGTQRFAVYMSIIAGFLGVGLAAAAGSHICGGRILCCFVLAHRLRDGRHRSGAGLGALAYSDCYTIRIFFNNLALSAVCPFSQSEPS